MARAPRVCPTPGCPRLTSGGYCTTHRAERERARGTRQERGYDADYDRRRKAALDGATRCSSCGAAFSDDNPATGGHVVDIRAGGTTADGVVAECRRCNLGWRRGESTST